MSIVRYGAAILLVATTACGSDEPTGSTGDSVNATAATTTEIAGPGDPSTVSTQPPTAESTVADPTTTDAEPTTTPADATTTTVAPATWTETTAPGSAYSDGSFDAYGSFVAGPSPPFPRPGAPLADGVYPAAFPVEWSSDQPGVLRVSLYRLESCEAPGMTDVSDSCESGFYEAGVDPATMFPIEIPLDSSIRTVVVGADCRDTSDVGRERVTKQADGTALRVLYEAYTADYQRVIAPLLPTTTNRLALVEQIATSPSGGFAAGHREGCTWSLTFTAGDAPPVLMQTIASSELDSSGALQPLLATSAINLSTVIVEDGMLSLYFYAGFQS
jgi:hypothetical protein